MRKLFTSFLTLALASSISAAAFATNATTNDGSSGTNINVSGTFKTAYDASQVIYVNIIWDNMNFTYLSEGSWDPKTHSVSDKGTWRWNDATEEQPNPKITVTNHSATAVKASLEFNSEVEGLAGSFTDLTDDALHLETAWNTSVTDAPTKSTFFSITEGAIGWEYDTLGTITVTVSKDTTSNSKDTAPDTDVTQ